MSLNSADIRNHEFQKSFRGFDASEVQEFLEELAGEWEKLQRERDELQLKVGQLDTLMNDFRMMERAVQQTLTQAQEVSATAVETAKREAQLLLRKAEVEASHTLEHAKLELTSLREQIAIFATKRDAVLTQLKSFLTSELEIIASLQRETEQINSGISEPEKALASSEHHSPSAVELEIKEIIKKLDEE